MDWITWGLLGMAAALFVVAMSPCLERMVAYQVGLIGKAWKLSVIRRDRLRHEGDARARAMASLGRLPSFQRGPKSLRTAPAPRADRPVSESFLHDLEAGAPDLVAYIRKHQGQA